MAFKRIQLMEIWEILRRWHDGQTISTIATCLGYDRKTVRAYIRLACDLGLTRETVLERKDAIFPQIQAAIERLHSKAAKQALLGTYVDEILSLVNGTENPLKPKTAFEVICERHNLKGKVSYSSFKRMARARQISVASQRTTCRIELPPAEQLQVDYARMGLLYDPGEQRRRTVHAFIGTLSFSRHKFVEFVFSQNQQSFLKSHVAMFEYFSGSTKTVVIDNLKTGVLKPDIYDPTLNRAYAELAEHYHTFIDPGRIASPKDKGKVERDVQTVREFYRKTLALHPSITITEFNHMARHWLLRDYGQRSHGSTGEKPIVLFRDYEQKALIPLPPEPYTVALWKEAIVHPDHYIQINRRFYSVPDPFVGKTVQVKVTPSTIEVFYKEQLIKTHPIARTLRSTDWSDFPPNVQHVLDGGLPRLLCMKARHIGINFEMLITQILSLHAYMNLRRAQGLVTLASRYPREVVETAARHALTFRSTVGYKSFKHLMEALIKDTSDSGDELQLSLETQSFVRSMDYFTHNTGDTNNV
ncbi:MAG: IS21 family transposase [bacterium]